MLDSRVPMWRSQPMQQNKTGPAGTPPPDAPPSGDAGEAPPAPVSDEVSPANAPGDKGFPTGTKVADMEPAEQAAYYKWQNRKAEDRLRQLADYDDLKAYRDAAERDKLSEHDKAVMAARDEGRNAALTEANQRAATAILRANLTARGRTADEAADIMAAFNANAFIKDNEVDTDRIAAFVTTIAGPVTGNGKLWPPSGQGNQDRVNPVAGVSTGAQMYAASRTKP